MAENIPVFEDVFCNHHDVTPEVFNGDLDELIERTELHKGRLISLWPWGYKVNQHIRPLKIFYIFQMFKTYKSTLEII